MKQTDWKDSTKAVMEAYGDNPKDFPYQEPKQERSYSEEEVINILVEFSAEIKSIWNITEWFEQFKKK